MTRPCHSCGKEFEDYKTLAVHILSSDRKTHKYGRPLAAKVTMNVTRLNKIKDPETRTKLTEEEKETKASAFREVSGQTETALCVCPHCKQGHSENLEVEFSGSGAAWRGKTGLPVILCSSCR